MELWEGLALIALPFDLKRKQKESTAFLYTVSAHKREQHTPACKKQFCPFLPCASTPL